jgi:hypothetical protein
MPVTIKTLYVDERNTWYAWLTENRAKKKGLARIPEGVSIVGGPKLGFEPRQKAPQASRLPSYLTSATIY